MQRIKLSQFLRLERSEIAKLIRKERRPRCVAIMLDGTRRVLKFDPKYRDDSWSYYENPNKNLIYKSIEVAGILFDLGVEIVIGPLASTGNLHRKGFVPEGIKQLLQSFLDPYPLTVFKKHSVKLSFYGDLQYAYQLEGGKIISDYVKEISNLSAKDTKKYIVMGVGYSTERETEIIAHKAIEYYMKFNKKPSFEELVRIYFGFDALPIDILIRSNEVRPSGGLTPLLTTHGTQLYFPVSPGILSFSEKVIRSIIYDYLFSRVLSKGTYDHRPITTKQSKEIRNFYFGSKDVVLGLGRRVGDIWISKPIKSKS